MQLTFGDAEDLNPGACTKRRDLLRAVPLIACGNELGAAPHSDSPFASALSQFEHDQHADLRAVTVLRDGRPAVRHLYNGASASELHDGRSAGKSITALLAGAAFDRGLMHDLADPVQRYLPQSRGSAFADVPLRDLLDMRSGVDACDDDSASPGNEDLMDAAPDPVAFAWSVPRAAAPGTVYRYNSLAAYVAGLVVQEACGQDLEAFARDALFAPLGITRWHWARDAAGHVKGQGNLSLAVDDFARIGQMVLDGGRHAGRRVIGRAWTDATLRPTVSMGDTDPFAERYGRYWYQTTHAASGEPVQVSFASGNGGNKIYVIPRAPHGGGDHEPRVRPRLRTASLAGHPQGAACGGLSEDAGLISSKKCAGPGRSKIPIPIRN